MGVQKFILMEVKCQPLRRKRQLGIIKSVCIDDTGYNYDPYEMTDKDDRYEMTDKDNPPVKLDDPGVTYGCVQPNVNSNVCCHRHEGAHDAILIIIFVVWGALCGLPSMAYSWSKVCRSPDSGQYPKFKDLEKLDSWALCRAHAATYVASLLLCLVMWEAPGCCTCYPGDYQKCCEHLHCCGIPCKCLSGINPQVQAWDCGSLWAIPIFSTISIVCVCYT